MPGATPRYRSQLLFVLEVEDGWPSVAKERLPCTVVKGGYRVEAAPFFIKGLSVGDMLAVQRNGPGEVIAWRHVRKSRRSTVWIGITGDNSVEDALERLKRLKCNIEHFTQYRYYAADVPEERPMASLDERLDSLEKRAYVAFPSFRH